MRGDITNPRVLYVKAGLFVLGGTMAAAVILIDRPSWKLALLLALTVWCFARAYYFAFYVIEHYIDPRSIGMPSASNIARALTSVSSYSAAGSESATMPPPTGMWIRPSRRVIV